MYGLIMVVEMSPSSSDMIEPRSAETAHAWLTFETKWSWMIACSTLIAIDLPRMAGIQG